MKLNPAETEALVRAIDGLGTHESFDSVELSRRDSLNNPHNDGFLIVQVNWSDGGTSADAISETGATTAWEHR